MDIITNYLLFSHTYLDQLAADTAHDEKAGELAHGLRDWLPSRDASSLRSLIDTWVGPVLDFLEFGRTEEQADPHVILLQGQGGDAKPAGLCYVVETGSDLNGTIRGAHPMAQAVLALRRHNLRWGMLTDGVRWRLLDAMSLRRYEAYLQVDLDLLARSADSGPLRLFHACFHRRAFDLSSNGKAGLGRLHEASEKATETAEHHLKARVSNQDGIMAQLCRGLIAATGRLKFTDEDRDQIYQDATYLLYRMLFILHAEARDLLPMSHPDYAAASLTALVETARSYQSDGLPEPFGTGLWDRLKRLCTAIYESDPGLDIPAYNGGLFDDAEKPYLRSGHVVDQYLAPALCDLGCLPDATLPNAYRCVDYRDLSVRHLGNLYEGMIEYRLFVAEEPMIGRRDDKGNVRYLTQAEAGLPKRTDQEIATGGVYFAQSAGERRSTGTYYTPEFIVDHIVYETVIRKLRERRAPLEAKIRVWLAEIAATRDPEERARMQRVVDKALLDFVESQVLTFRCCDPAMGSGHFLVNTAHQITNFIVETLHLASWPSAEVDADPAAWRRRVAEHCLYGVDLSPMAVELAKLSLWLATMSRGKPLSFLDHHLRRGNSLTGTNLSDLAAILADRGSDTKSRQAEKAGQLSLLDEPTFRQHVTVATGLLTRIAAQTALSSHDVKGQASDYERVRAELARYRRLADIRIARLFGVALSDQQFRDVAKYLLNGSLSTVPEYERLIESVARLARTKGFFHWELEFPEIFFDEKGHLRGSRGFDSVMGNPPYVSNWELTASDELMPRALEALYSEVATGHWDLYVMFVFRALSLLNHTGLNSFIVPSSFAKERYGLGVRKHILTKRRLVALVDFGDRQVFENVSRQYLIYLVGNPEPGQDQTGLYRYTGNAFTRSGELGQSAFLSFANCTFRTDLRQADTNLKGKLESGCVRLGSLCCVNPGVVAHSRAGSPVSFTKDDVIGSRKPDDGFKRYLGGDDVGRWSVRWNGLFMDYGSKRAYFHRPKFPELFESPKIMVRGVSGPDNSIVSAYDEDGYYTNHSLFHLISWTQEIKTLQQPAAGYAIDSDSTGYDLRYIAGILNSNTMNYYFSRFLATGTLQGSYSGVYPEDMRALPIRRIPTSLPAEVRMHSAATARDLYHHHLDTGDPHALLDSVRGWATQASAEVAIVHDLIVYLVGQIVEAQKRTQDEIRSFLQWLEKWIESSLATLSNNTRLRNYLGDYQKGEMHMELPEVMGILRQNRRRLPLDLTAPGVQEQLSEKYEANLSVLLPLKTRLAATDRLINLIVYELYGLTEEEIAVVEGRS